MTSGQNRLWFLAIALGLTAQAVAQATTGSGFTYQGLLKQNGAPINGDVSLRLALYDAEVGGSQVDTPIEKLHVPVQGGLFTDTLEFDPGVFDGMDRWLEITVGTAGQSPINVLSPRQRITPAPYSLGFVPGANSTGSLPSSAVLYAANKNTDDNSIAIKGVASGTTGYTIGVLGSNESNQGWGVVGSADALSGSGTGVIGQCFGESGRGLWGLAANTNGTNYGLYSETDSPVGYAGYFVGGRNFFEGNVGIGTTTPVTKLDVRGDILSDNVFGFSNIQQGPTLVSTYISAPAGDTLGFYTSSAERVRIDSSGNVGIGTSAPTAKLEVGGIAGTDGIRYPDGRLQTTALPSGTALDQVLKWNDIAERWFAVSDGATSLHTQSFPNPGTFGFTVPQGVTRIEVELWGAGGGGGGGGTRGPTPGQCGGGGGAGGGGAYTRSLSDVTPGETFQVVVGAAGAGGAGGIFGGMNPVNPGADATDGHDSRFVGAGNVLLLSAGGGKGGQGGISPCAEPAAGGAGGISDAGADHTATGHGGENGSCSTLFYSPGGSGGTAISGRYGNSAGSGGNGGDGQCTNNPASGGDGHAGMKGQVSIHW